jgi:site-specific DNA recombinase
MVARMLGAAARHEAEHKAERQRREHRQRAEAGRFAGGGQRPFGYTRVYDGDGDTRPRRVLRDEINEEEAAIIRECAQRVLAGESLSSVCREMAARDVRTSGGNHFIPFTLRMLLGSARISGRRELKPRDSYRGKARPLVGEITAQVAAWPAIITVDESDRLRELLARPDRLRYAPGTGRTYLLSGMLRCARCGGRMVGRARDGVPRYICPNLPGGKTCGGMATQAERTDNLIRDMVLVALASPDLADQLRKWEGVDPDLVGRIRRAEDRLTELATDYATDQISRAEWMAARQVLEQQLNHDRDILARTSRTTVLDDFIGSADDLANRWAILNVSQRQSIVGAVIDRIICNPANPHKRWDPDRFEIIWRA